MLLGQETLGKSLSMSYMFIAKEINVKRNFEKI
jgi:hypothetical protein